MATVARLVTQVDTKGVATAKRELGGFGKAANDASGKSTKLSKAGGIATTVVVGLGAAAAVSAGAITTLVVSSSKANKELATLARQAKLTTTEFRALAFATEQYGINGEQIADISKDISDKVGEFATEGTGAFQDYIDVMGLTEAQAQATAERFQFMSGPDVLQEMVAQMEGAGATTAKMTFALESMGNDASRLIPLFKENGVELDRLTSRFDSATSAIALTSAQSQQLDKAAESFSVLSEQSSLAAQQLAAVFAPAIDKTFGLLIQFVPRATNAVVDFFNKFKDAENINSLRSIDSEMAKINGRMAENIRISKERVGPQRRDALSRIDRDTKRLAALTAQREELERINRLEKVKEGNLATSSGSSVNGIQGVVTADGGIDTGSLDRLREQLATEEELIARSYNERQRLLDEQLALNLVSQSEYQELSRRSTQEYTDALTAIDKDREKVKQDFISDSFGKLATLTSSGNKRLFAIGKAAALAGAYVDTAAGVTKALGSAPPPLNFINAAAVGVAGGLQIATIAKQAPPTARVQGGNLLAGQSTAIAEKQPEVFIPRTSGTVKNLSDMGGNQPIDISIAINMPETAEGQPQVQTNIQGANAAFVRKIMVSDASNKNSQFAKAVRRTING